MEERLMIYVYCGKLVKLMKAYKEEFVYGFKYDKFSFTLDFSMISENAECCIKKKEELAQGMVKVIQAYIESYQDEVNVDKLNELIQKIMANVTEIAETVKKVRWNHTMDRGDMNFWEYMECFFDEDSLKEDIVEQYEEFNSVEDVTDEDIINLCQYDSVSEIYFYDKRTNREASYLSI